MAAIAESLVIHESHARKNRQDFIVAISRTSEHIVVGTYDVIMVTSETCMVYDTNLIQSPTRHYGCRKCATTTAWSP